MYEVRLETLSQGIQGIYISWNMANFVRFKNYKTTPIRQNNDAKHKALIKETWNKQGNLTY